MSCPSQVSQLNSSRPQSHPSTIHRLSRSWPVSPKTTSPCADLTTASYLKSPAQWHGQSIGSCQALPNTEGVLAMRAGGDLTTTRLTAQDVSPSPSHTGATTEPSSQWPGAPIKGEGGFAMGKITSFSSFAMESGAAVRDIIMELSALVAALMTMSRAPMGNDGDQKRRLRCKTTQFRLSVPSDDCRLVCCFSPRTANN